MLYMNFSLIDERFERTCFIYPLTIINQGARITRVIIFLYFITSIVYDHSLIYVSLSIYAFKDFWGTYHYNKYTGLVSFI